MHKQLKVTAIAACLLIGGASFAISQDENPYGEPSPNYLRQYRQEGVRTLVLERFDADGRLVARSVARLDGKVVIEGPVERTIAGLKIALRGLTAWVEREGTFSLGETVRLHVPDQRVWAHLDAAGRVVRHKVQDPSLRNWLGLALSLRDNEISDFPICNKSYDLSYCGNDL